MQIEVYSVVLKLTHPLKPNNINYGHFSVLNSYLIFYIQS